MISDGPVVDAVRLLVHAVTEHPHRHDLVERARDGVEAAFQDLDDALRARTGIRLSWWDDDAGQEADSRARPAGDGVTVHLRVRHGRGRRLHRALVAELAARTGEPPGELRRRDGHDLLTDLLHLVTSELVERLDHAVDSTTVARG